MRLQRIEKGRLVKTKIMYAFMHLVTRRRAPDIVRCLWYRPDFFGEHMDEWTNAVMRGPSDWSVADRELFATFASRLNQCVF